MLENKQLKVEVRCRARQLLNAINDLPGIKEFEYSEDDLSWLTLAYDKYKIYVCKLNKSNIQGHVYDKDVPIRFELNGRSFKWDI